MVFWTFLLGAVVALAALIGVRRLAPAGTAKQMWQVILSYGIAILMAAGGVFAVISALRRG